jgi:hypothetical protein
MHKRFAVPSFFAVMLLSSASMTFAQEARTAVAQDCEDLDFSIKREGSPYHYTNPNEACGISLKMDGLPSKSSGGYSTGGNDACGQIQGVVGNLEGRLNEELQGALGAVGDVVSPDELEQLGAAAGVDSGGAADVMRDGVNVADFGLNQNVTETIGGLATEEGRDALANDLQDGAANAARDSFESMGQPSSTTPGINANQQGANQDSSEWSIFD